MTRRFRLSRRTAFIAASVALSFGTFGFDAGAAYPEKPIKIVVPTQAGGGMDSVARILQRYFESSDALGQKVVVVNMPGAGGTIGTRSIMEAEPDGYTVGFWHEGLITSKAMGVVDYDHDSFEVLGATGYGDLGFGVSVNSPYQSFEGLLAAAKAEPQCGEGRDQRRLARAFRAVDGAGCRRGSISLRPGGWRREAISLGGGYAHRFRHLRIARIHQMGGCRFEADRDVLRGAPGAAPRRADREGTWHRRCRQRPSHLAGPKGTPQETMDHLVVALRTAMEDADVQAQFKELGLAPEFVEPDALTAILDGWRDRALPLVEKARELQQ